MHCRSSLLFALTLLSYVHLSFQQYGVEPSNIDILNAISDLEYRLEERLEDLLDDRFAKLLEMKLSNLLEKKLASVHERFNIMEDELLAVRDDLSYIRGEMMRNISEEFHDKSTDVGTFTQDVTRSSLPSHSDQSTSIPQSIPTLYPTRQPIAYPTVPPAICSFTRQPTSTTTLSGLTMWKAAKKGALAFVNKALASGTYVDWQNNNRSNYTALHVAARFNHPAVVKALLDACADKDLQSDGGMTPVYVASLYGNTDVVSILIANGADIDIPINNGRTPLHAAAFNDHPDTVKLLLVYVEDTKKQDIRGKTPADLARNKGLYGIANFINDTISMATSVSNETMWVAAERGQLAFVNKALDMGDIEVNWRNLDRSGYTALHAAARFNHPAIVAALIFAGADMDIGDNYNQTPLHVAIYAGNTDVVRILLDQGADPNIARYEGSTPLHVAARYNETAIAQLLIQDGANTRKQDDQGRTPADDARLYGNDELAKNIDNFTYLMAP